MHQMIPSEQRATVISFDSLIGSGGSAGGQAGLGYLSQTRSISYGYIVGGLVTLLVLPVQVMLRRLNSPADVIVGTAGRQGRLPGSRDSDGGLPTYSPDGGNWTYYRFMI